MLYFETCDNEESHFLKVIFPRNLGSERSQEYSETGLVYFSLTKKNHQKHRNFVEIGQKLRFHNFTNAFGKEVF